MSENFGFELPDESKELTDKEYVNLVNRIRGNFLSYVSVLDSTLTLIITDFFLRDKDDFPLWAKTVFDEDRTASFGTKIVWLSRIIKSHSQFQKEIDEKNRVQLQQKLNEIRIIRNDFAHNFAQNKKIESENVKNRVIMLYDFEEGKTVPKLFKMQEIMDMINDGWVLEQLNQIELVTKKIREN
ncbi:hypothetical protein [Nitrosopumilus sp.]|uniref:hypothetical protein n=1 Tax=Nitrosopumilus sp. TaxID=2024843 RepID=UPI00262C7837|nr:hypothetical protein [Nitrosopumilus sp.]